MFAAPAPQAFLAHEFLNSHYSFKDCFRPWRTTRHIHINRHYLIDALQHTVSIEDTAAACTGANSHHPAGLSHLQVHLLYHRRHLLRDCTDYHEEVALPG